MFQLVCSLKKTEKICKPARCLASWCSLLDLRGGNTSVVVLDQVATLTSDGPEKGQNIPIVPLKSDCQKILEVGDLYPNDEKLIKRIFPS